MKNLAILGLVILVSAGCMKTEHLGTVGGGSKFANGTAGVKTGDKYLTSMLQSLGVTANDEIRNTYSTGRNAMPFSGEFSNVTTVGTYADNGLAMRVALIAVDAGLANNGSDENKAIFEPARVNSAMFDESRFIAVAQNAALRIFRRPLIPAEQSVLLSDVFAGLRGAGAMSDALRREILIVGIAAMLTSQEARSSN